MSGSAGHPAAASPARRSHDAAGQQPGCRRLGCRRLAVESSAVERHGSTVGAAGPRMARSPPEEEGRVSSCRSAHHLLFQVPASKELTSDRAFANCHVPGTTGHRRRRGHATCATRPCRRSWRCRPVSGCRCSRRGSPGLCIVTTAWETRDAMHASVSKIRPIRERIAKTLGGIAEVEEWEVAAMNRLHSSAQAACARVTWLRVERADADDVVKDFHAETLPALRAIRGFCSTSLLVNRERARVAVSVAYDGPEAMQRRMSRSDGRHQVGRQRHRRAGFRSGDAASAGAGPGVLLSRLSTEASPSGVQHARWGLRAGTSSAARQQLTDPRRRQVSSRYSQSRTTVSVPCWKRSTSATRSRSRLATFSGSPAIALYTEIVGP